MGTIVCQTCESTIDHFEDEKVSVLYGKCLSCNENHTISHKEKNKHAR